MFVSMIQVSHRKVRTAPTWAAWRAFWVGMLAVHLVPILTLSGLLGGEAGSPDRILRLLMLLASAGFFGLKIIDVSWLRVNPGWRSTVVSLLVVALLHLGVLERSTGVDLINPLPASQMVMLAGGVAAAEVLRRVMRLVQSAPRTERACHPQVYLRPLQVACFDLLRPPPWWVALRSRIPRAPPV